MPRKTSSRPCSSSVRLPETDPLERIVPVTFLSRQLKQRRNILVYLPPGYAAARKRYPILYLLHGRYGSEIDWLLKGKVHLTLDSMILQGEVVPMIVAMPNDGLYDTGTFYMDWYDGTGQFERYFLNEVVREVETAFRTASTRSGRAIAGLSMGGYGALTLALRHPRTFCAAASLSGVTMPISPKLWGAWARRVFGPLRGDGAKYRKQRDPRYLVTLPATGSVRLHLNCGRSDFLLQQNRKFHRLLQRIGRQHEYMEFPGSHNWKYWSRHVREVLLFVSRCFESST